jgi:hypothetical protein
MAVGVEPVEVPQQVVGGAGAVVADHLKVLADTDQQLGPPSRRLR